MIIKMWNCHHSQLLACTRASIAVFSERFHPPRAGEPPSSHHPGRHRRPSGERWWRPPFPAAHNHPLSPSSPVNKSQGARSWRWPATSSGPGSVDSCPPPSDPVISGLDPAVGARRGARSLSSCRPPALVTTGSIKAGHQRWCRASWGPGSVNPSTLPPDLASERRRRWYGGLVAVSTSRGLLVVAGHDSNWPALSCNGRGGIRRVADPRGWGTPGSRLEAAAPLHRSLTPPNALASRPCCSGEWRRLGVAIWTPGRRPRCP